MKKYNLQVTRVPSSDNYFFVLLTKKEHGLNIYVNLLKSEFADLFKLDKRNYPTEETDVKEYNWYLHCKDQTQPLWMLSKKHLQELGARLLVD